MSNKKEIEYRFKILKKTPTEKDVARFFSRIFGVDINSCWNWQGGLGAGGYGHFKVGRQMISSHRMMFQIIKGEPPKLCVLHKCDNRKCVNPYHLYEGTHAQNAADTTARQRWAFGSKNGSKKYPERLRRGELVNTAKITAKDVVEIRSSYGKNGVRQKDLSFKFGLTQAVISKIVRRTIWRHVP